MPGVELRARGRWKSDPGLVAEAAPSALVQKLGAGVTSAVRLSTLLHDDEVEEIGSASK